MLILKLIANFMNDAETFAMIDIAMTDSKT